MLRMSRADEALVALKSQEFEQIFVAAGIQLGGHVVEKQDRRLSVSVFEEVELGSFPGQDHGAELSLRGESARRMAAE